MLEIEINSHICISGALVEWCPPEDDGGTPITQYIIEKAEGASVNWTVCGQTKGATKCRVTGLKTGKDHRLQVNCINFCQLISIISLVHCWQKKSYKYCFMKQKFQLQMGIARYRNVTTPLSTKVINTTYQHFQMRYIALF